MLYSKKYLEKEVSLDGCMLFSEGALTDLKRCNPKYENVYCHEVNIINKIKYNQEGFFDFSKNLIDVGASIGEYPVCLNFAKNYIFEPYKTLLWTCQANLVNTNKVEKSYTYQVALSDRNDIEEICTNSGDSLIWEFNYVETRTLDSFNIDNVGLIKIDVEGFEEKVIRGGVGTIIRNNYPPILFECWVVDESNKTTFKWNQEKRDSLLNLLKTLGYEILECWGDNDTHLAIHKKD